MKLLTKAMKVAKILHTYIHTYKAYAKNREEVSIY